MIVVFTGTASWFTLYNVASLPGPKLCNGIILGLAEATAALSSGFVLQYASDITAALFFCGTCFVFNIAYRVLGAGDGGLLSMFALFKSILGIGGVVNISYLLIELRVPPENLGASMVILLTLSIFVSGCAPNLAYLPQPIPLYCLLMMLLCILIALIYLPPAGQFLPKEDR